jgi:hypothetical protein
MRLVITASVLAVFVSGCSHAQASRWKANGAYTVCTCDGTERQPTPGEASDFREGERVDVFCEGRVRDCHAGSLHPPRSTGEDPD